MASSQDSNSPPNSPFGGVSPSGPAAVVNNFNQGVYSPNMDNVGSPIDDLGRDLNMTNRGRAMVGRGVPDVPAAVAGQQSQAGIPQYISQLAQSGPLVTSLDRMRLNIAQGGIAGNPGVQMATPSNIGPYANYGQAVNTASLFINPAFQQQVAGGVAQSEMHAIGGMAQHYMEQGLNQHSAMATAYHQRMANKAPGGVGRSIGLRGALGDNFANTADPHAYLQGHIYGTALQDIQTSTQPLAQAYNALPASVRQEANRNIRSTTVGELAAANTVISTTEMLQARGVDPAANLNFNAVMGLMGQDSAFADSNLNQQIVSNPMAADPYKAVMSGATRSRVHAASSIAQTSGLQAHLLGGGDPININTSGAGGTNQPPGDPPSTGGPSGTGGGGGNNALITALNNLTTAVSNNTTQQQKALPGPSGPQTVTGGAGGLAVTPHGGAMAVQGNVGMIPPTGGLPVQGTVGIHQPMGGHLVQGTMGLAPGTQVGIHQPAGGHLVQGTMGLAPGSQVGLNFGTDADGNPRTALPVTGSLGIGQRASFRNISGFVSGLFGGQATADDTDARRRSKGAGRVAASVIPALGSAVAGASIGSDLNAMLSSVPGFNRGFEGISVLSEFAGMAAGGELPALQASMLLGKGGSGTFMNKQMGGNMGVGAEFGISAEQMGSFILPMASAAGGGMKAGDIQRFTRGFAAGEDMGGIASLIGQQRMAGFTDNRAAEFNAAKAANLKGSAATGFASQLFGAFRGVSAGSGITMSRLGTEGRILGMGGGDIAAGTARFQRGRNVHTSARQMLMSPFQDIASELLMAEALNRSGGVISEAGRLIERDEAQGGAMLKTRLQALNIHDEEILKLLQGGGGLTSEDMEAMDRQRSVKGGSRFNLDQATGGNATFFSSRLATRRNEQIDTALSGRGRSMFEEIQKQEKKVEDKLISNLSKNIKSLNSLTDNVILLNDAITEAVKFARKPVEASTALGPAGVIAAMALYTFTLTQLGIK